MPSQITLLVKKRHPTSRLPKPVQDTLRTAKLAARKALLDSLGTELDTAAAQNNGRLPYNYMSNLVKKVHQNPSMDWVTADVINGHRRRMKEKQMEEHSSPPLEQSHMSNSNDDKARRNKGGRPKGTTNENAHSTTVKIIRATNIVTTKYNALREKCNSEGKRVPKGSIDDIIERAKADLSLDSSIIIPHSTIRARILRGNLQPLVPRGGLVSPMLEIEPLLVGIIVFLQGARQPVGKKVILALANDLVKDTGIEEKVIAFKKKYCGINCNTADLGPKYYEDFMKRNGHLLESKRGEKFANDRSEWSSYTNFEFMYDDIYDELVKSGNATKHNEALFFDKNGNRVETEEEAFGLPTQYVLIRPENVFHMDECGNNTNQKKDGPKGGSKMVCKKGTTPKIICATTDTHFTVLGVTASSNHPVMCVVIFAGEKMDPLWAMGADLFAEVNGSVEDIHFMRNNSGPGKYHPFGPTCNFRGVEVPCLCMATPSGGITSDTLTLILQTLDKYGATERGPGVKPHLIVDGHGSRFELPFLKYVTNEETKWSVCIGVPYGTSYWQVGDSSEQNGSWKMAATQAKEDLVKLKLKRQMPITIEKTDVIPLTNYAWKRSFARKESNQKALCARGWNPLNYNLLLHPEIAATKPITAKPITANQAEPESSITMGVPTFNRLNVSKNACLGLNK
jgi:hypothetical protein